MLVGRTRSGYYKTSDNRVLESIESMVRMYDADGANSFVTAPAEYGILFVLDARTLLGGLFSQIRTSTVSTGFDLFILLYI